VERRKFSHLNKAAKLCATYVLFYLLLSYGSIPTDPTCRGLFPGGEEAVEVAMGNSCVPGARKDSVNLLFCLFLEYLCYKYDHCCDVGRLLFQNQIFPCNLYSTCEHN
jgi:hypothetical protein